MRKRLIAIVLIASLLTGMCMFQVSALKSIDTSSPYTGEYMLVYNTNKNASTTQSTGNINANMQMFSMQSLEADETSESDANEEEIRDVVEIDGEEYYEMEYVNPFAPSFEDALTQLGELPEGDFPVDDEVSENGLLSAAPMMSMDMDGELLDAPPVYDLQPNRDFTAYDIYNNKNYDLTAKHLFEGKYCDVWVESSTNGNLITTTHAKEMGNYFDNTIQPMMLKNFGSYISGSTVGTLKRDGKIIILIHDIRDPYFYLKTPGSAFVAGYFDTADLLTGSGGTGNKTSMIHIGIDPLLKSGSSILMSKGYRTLTHEFQHLIHYTASVRRGQIDSMWLDEAFSIASEHMLAGTALIDRILQFNSSETVQVHGAALCYGAYTQNGGDIGANYGLPYLFSQYLRTQTKKYSGGGNSIYKSILASNLVGHEAIMEALDNLGYSEANSITNFDTFHRNFRIALFAHEPLGPYGFDGEEAFDDVIVQINDGKKPVDLKGTASILVKITKPSFAASGAGANIKFCGFTLDDKPQAPMPTVNKPSSEVARGTEIKLSTTLEDATVLYTTDGSDPRVSATVSAANPSFPILILVSGTKIKAITRRRGYIDSEVATFTYTIPLQIGRAHV